jgi:hypothetical protein
MDEIRIIKSYQYGETVLHPVALLAMVIGILLVLLSPRKYVLPSMIAIITMIPEMQRIVILGFDLNTMRIMALAGIARVALREKKSTIVLSNLDMAFVLWVISSTSLNIVQRGSVEALVNRFGFALTALCSFFSVRSMIETEEDFLRLFRAIELCCILVGLSMVIEMGIGRSLFSILGGIPQETLVRSGRARCQGPFSHPILAGTFGAVTFPLMVVLLVRKKNDIGAWLGTVGSLAIVVTSGSSGPVLSLVASVVGLVAWAVRKRMREVRHLIVCCVILLALVMKAPIWALVARLDIVGGSTGYHRYLLIDAFIRNAGQWILVGTENAQYWGWGLQDLTNQYVLEGVSAGLIPLALFVAIIAFAFKYSGETVKLVPNAVIWRRYIPWAMGVQLFTHAVSFISVSYFDQIVFHWYLVLAAIAALRQIRREATDVALAAA